MASSGDDGIAGNLFRAYLPVSECGYYASWPASSPYVTAVGATMNGAALSGSPEIVCSTATGSVITSGGGFSNQLSAPSFQKSAIAGYLKQYTPGQPTDAQAATYNTAHRGYPDVSMPGNDYGKPHMISFCAY